MFFVVGILRMKLINPIRSGRKEKWWTMSYLWIYHMRTHMIFMLHPGRLTWNIQITHLERKMIFQTSMIMFHVNLQGCIYHIKSTFEPPPQKQRFGKINLFVMISGNMEWREIRESHVRGFLVNKKVMTSPTRHTCHPKQNSCRSGLFGERHPLGLLITLQNHNLCCQGIIKHRDCFAQTKL